MGSMTRMRDSRRAAVGGGVAEVFGADLVREEDVAVGSLGVALDEDFAGVQRDGGDGLVLEVDEVRADEDEDQDGGDHDVVLNAAALVGPEDVAVDEFHHWARPKGWWVMTVSPSM